MQIVGVAGWCENHGMETQTITRDDIGQQIEQAVLQAAMDAATDPPVTDQAVVKKSDEKRKVGDGTPGPGRPRGVANRTTRTIRDAVEIAARQCHPEGLAGWLIERAQGSLGDRQIFAQMVNKAMPLQVQAQVGGGVQIQLSWLGQRQIATTVAQQAEQRTQVLDLQAEKDGTYRIIDPVTEPGPASPGPKTSDPLPPIDPVVGPG